MSVGIPVIVAEAGGEVVGKIRLQKIVYLLDRMGTSCGYQFEYHHYGPYSKELAEQVEDEVFSGHLLSEVKRRQSDGVPYSVYRSVNEHKDQKISTDIRRAISAMNQRSATVLELAATINWLCEVEGMKDWRRELDSRKGAKAGGGRTEKAMELLRELKLRPAA